MASTPELSTNDSPTIGLPTAREVRRLAEAIASDGFAHHGERLQAVIAAARRSGLQPGTVDVLADASSPPVARARALGRLALFWGEHRGAVRDGEVADRPILVLLDAWNAHEDLRIGRASVGDLAESRLRLDAARDALSSSRERRSA